MGKYTLDFTASEINERLGKLDNMPISKTLLWENANKGSQFPSQTISLDLSGYNEIEVICAYYYGGDGNISKTCAIGATATIQEMIQTVNGDSALYLVGRQVTATSAGVSFGPGGYKYLNNAIRTTSESYCVPYKVYGIKGVQ